MSSLARLALFVLLRVSKPDDDFTKAVGAKTHMGEIGSFTQPDRSPAYFPDFLEFLDNQPNIKSFRAEALKRMNLAAGLKVLDLGCGIGGATFPIADVTDPTLLREIESEGFFARLQR